MPEAESEPNEIDRDFAIEILRGIIADIGDNWSGYGCKLWIEYAIRDLEVDDDSLGC